MSELHCINREEFYKEFSNFITESPSNSFQFIGKHGVGKEYVLENVENQLRKKCEIYRVVSDTVVKRKQNISTHTLNVSFSLNSLVGMSLSLNKNDSQKMNYIIANLKSLTLKKIFLISATDYDRLPAESREFIDILLCNKKYIEEKINKKITVIITSNYDYFNGKYNIKNIIFRDYERADIYNYLLNNCNYSNQQITNEQLRQICELCGTNLNLVNNYAKLILNNSDEHITFENVVDTKLNFYIQSGNQYNLSSEELRSILLTSSMSIHMLTPNMISHINCINEQSVEKGFDCAVNHHFIEESSISQYQNNINFSFISQQEKEYLYHLAENSYVKKLENYYMYLSEVAEDEYFERLQYLFRYYGKINKSVFALIILAISKSFLLRDDLERNKIVDFFETNNHEDNFKHLFEIIYAAYIHYYNENYKEAIEEIEKINYSDVDNVLAAELRRLEFRSGYIGHALSLEQLNILSQELQAHLEQKIILDKINLLKEKDEKILSLRIIFELAPYVLDTLNAKEEFCKLYDNSLLIVNYVNNHFVKKGFAEYVINIFNRKAFLFAPPAQATIYYEQAVAYFKNNKIWNEFVISLASKAGNEIALHKYYKAISSCNLALATMNQFQLEIPQKEKIYNNLYVAEYLYFENEENNEIIEIKNKAVNIAEKLESLLTTTPCGTNHVILTNIASLYLYAGKEQKYYEAKQRLEESLDCKDVSAVNDLKINDFYRYHFAWYEFYVNLKHSNWKKCTGIINSLSSFYPSVFHNIEKMNLRVEAARYLVKCRHIPDMRKYGVNMLQYAPSDKKLYSSRGLPLSDLQFTSWE